MVALVAALGGTALAAPGLLTKAQVKKISKKQAAKQVERLAPGLTVARAANADAATTASRAEVADSAEPALFARVLQNGSVDAANSKGIDASMVSRPSTGIYCFGGLAGVRGAQVTTDYENASGSLVARFALSSSGAAGCPSTSQHQVRLLNVDSAVLQDGGFFIQMYR